MSLKSTLWKRFAPEGWTQPKARANRVHQDTTVSVQRELLELAVTRYWAARPDPRRSATVVPLPYAPVDQKETA